jgi:disulfide oxidoreductase YuzD
MLGISPRIASLEGKKIAMVHNNKPGAKTFLEAVEELLKVKYPGITFFHFDTTINLADKPEKYAAMANSCDAFILGSGD